MRLRVVCQVVFAVLTLCTLLIQTGCGGGGGIQNRLTRANNTFFSDDAKVLAIREASGVWLDADQIALFDRDLARIRQIYPYLGPIHTFPPFPMDQVWVAVKKGTPWIATWDSGNTTTGEPKLDALLAKYDAVSIGIAYKSDLLTYDSYYIHFAQSLNVNAMINEFRAASSSFEFVEENNYVGDGDDVKFHVTNGEKIYEFSHGFDCADGCAKRHFWTITLSGDGSLRLVESGSDLSGDPGWTGRAATIRDTASSRKAKSIQALSAVAH
jgi:hypothetical protein